MVWRVSYSEHWRESAGAAAGKRCAPATAKFLADAELTSLQWFLARSEDKNRMGTICVNP